MVIRWIRSLLTSSKKLVDRDQFGNSYFEFVKDSGKIQRSFEAANQTSHEDYKTGDIPHEWEAWLRGKRADPPLTEEIEKNLKYTTQVQMKAARKTKEDDERQTQAYADGLIARETPSVNSTAGKNKTSQPGTDANFQPDSWSPGGGTVRNSAETEHEKHEPESWKPGN